MILGTTRAVRVFAYPRPADLRNGYNGLYGMVKTGLGRDPLSGELYLFVNKRRDACKVLVFDGTGLCIFQKRLSRGRFASLWREDATAARLTASERVPEGGTPFRPMARYAPLVRESPRDARRAAQSSAGAARPQHDPDDDALRAPRSARDSG